MPDPSDLPVVRCTMSLAHEEHQWNHDPTDTTCLCPGVPVSIEPRPQIRTRATDEPVFTIRAQDILAPQALAAYAELARKLDLHDHAQAVEAIAVAMLQWQSSNAKSVKRPD